MILKILKSLEINYEVQRVYGNVVLDSVNIVFRDDNNLLDQIY